METRKYKVLVADDEYWTREKLRRIIQWEKYSLEFLEPAQDGEEVLEKLKENRPDILITDINMPYLNGVELLQRVQKEYPEVVTFVISGYDDFLYVKDSFLAGSINYLVKPVGKIDLVNALSKALEIIASRQSQKEEAHKQEMELQKAASFIQDREFTQLLNLKTAPFSQNVTLNHHMEFVGASLLLIKLHNLQEFVQLYDNDMNLLSFSIKKRLREVAGDEKLLIFNNTHRANEFLLLAERSQDRLERLAIQILKDLEAATQHPVTVVESAHAYSMETMHEAYVQNIARMMLRPFGKGNYFLRPIQGKAEENGITSRMTEKQMKEIQSCLKRGNAKGLKKVLMEDVGLLYCEEQGWTYLEVRQTVQRFIHYLMEYFSETMDARTVLDAQSMLEMADKAAESMDIHYLCEVLDDIMALFPISAISDSQDSIRTGIRQAVAYVDAHYFEELTLSSLAEQFHVESSYFSRMFRKEAGETLMLYICKKRMEKAVEYMGDASKNLTEIAFMVGYDDYTYFNKVFRKMMGKSPREYRGMLQREQEPGSNTNQ